MEKVKTLAGGVEAQAVHRMSTRRGFCAA